MMTFVETLRLPSGRTVEVSKASPVFRSWDGTMPTDCYGGKPVLDFEGRMAFAEVAILWNLQKSGWDGVWIDTYRNKFRQGYWDTPPTVLPPERKSLLNDIWSLRGGTRRGTWDVFCWRDGEYLFAESKWKDRDRIRPAQLQWLEAAMNVGLPVSSFLIVEWSIATAQTS